jgi:hypothetical protein
VLKVRFAEWTLDEGSRRLYSVGAPATCEAADSPCVVARTRVAGPDTTTLYVGTDCGVAVSTDSGAHWTHHSVGGAAVYSLVAQSNELIDAFVLYGQTTTSIVQSAAVPLRAVPIG